MSAKAKINLSSEPLVAQLAILNRENLLSFQKTLRKILQMTWPQIFHDQGLKWEEITTAPDIKVHAKLCRPYSIRINQKFRAVVTRVENEMIFISLHPDHDSAYE
jgi:plasmid maintenance system killer protein